MTPEEKQKECDRICGPYFSKESREKGMHELKSLDLNSPENFPILRDSWHNPKRKNDYGVEFK